MKSKTASSLFADSLDSSSSEDLFADFVDRVKANPQSRGVPLVRLLRERHPVYRGRSTNSINRMRGYAMAAFEHTGLPSTALPYVLESLESAFHPYAVAGAARAIRGMRRPHPQVSPYLVKAIYNVWQGDQPISFASYRVQWPLESFSTAVTEIFDTLAGMGGFAKAALADLEILHKDYRAQFDQNTLLKLEETIVSIRSDVENQLEDCCGVPLHAQFPVEQASDEANLNPILEDQDGMRVQWKDFFQGKHSVLAFFYTRCTNPRKCTLTIQTLVAVQQALKNSGLSEKVRTAAITYDSQYDRGPVLKAYGNARRFGFSADHKMFRVHSGFDQILESLDLGVNFRGTVVNHHRIEFFILDSNGKVTESFLRLKVGAEQLIGAISNEIFNGDAKGGDTNSLTAKSTASVHSKTKSGNFLSNFFAVVLPCLVAFYPKCPMCWASYMSILGVSGFGSIPHTPWLLPIIVGLMFVNLVFLYRKANLRNGLLPFFCSCIGSLLLLLFWVTDGGFKWMLGPGIGMLFIGSLLNSLSYSKFNKLKLFFLNVWHGRPKRVVHAFLSSK